MDGGAKAKRRIVVAGEMLELGPDAPSIHRETGAALAASGIDLLIGVRGLGADLISEARKAGLNEAVFAENSDAAGELLAAEIRPGDIVLIKGSRGVRTEKVLEKLVSKFEMEKSEVVER